MAARARARTARFGRHIRHIPIKIWQFDSVKRRRRPGQFIQSRGRPEAKQASNGSRHSTKQRERSRIQIAGPGKGHSCAGGPPGAASTCLSGWRRRRRRRLFRRRVAATLQQSSYTAPAARRHTTPLSDTDSDSDPDTTFIDKWTACELQCNGQWTMDNGQWNLLRLLVLSLRSIAR